MLLVVLIPTSPLMFPFPLYVGLWILMCARTLVVYRVLLISSAMSAAALQFSVAAPAARGERIQRSLSEGFTARVAYIVAAVHFSADSRRMVPICSLRSTVYHT